MSHTLPQPLLPANDLNNPEDCCGVCYYVGTWSCYFDCATLTFKWRTGSQQFKAVKIQDAVPEYPLNVWRRKPYVPPETQDYCSFEMTVAEHCYVLVGQGITVENWHPDPPDLPTTSTMTPDGSELLLNMAACCGECCIATWKAGWDCSAGAWVVERLPNQHYIPCKNVEVGFWLSTDIDGEPTDLLTKYFFRKNTSTCDNFDPASPTPATPVALTPEEIESGCDGCCLAEWTCEYNCLSRQWGEIIAVAPKFISPCQSITQRKWTKVSGSTTKWSWKESRAGSCTSWNPTPPAAPPQASDGFEPAVSCGPAFWLATFSAQYNCTTNAMEWINDGEPNIILYRDSLPSPMNKWYTTEDNQCIWRYRVAGDAYVIPTADDFHPTRPALPTAADGVNSQACCGARWLYAEWQARFDCASNAWRTVVYRAPRIIAQLPNASPNKWAQVVSDSGVVDDYCLWSFHRRVNFYDYASIDDWNPVAPPAYPTVDDGWNKAECCGQCCVATWTRKWDCVNRTFLKTGEEVVQTQITPTNLAAPNPNVTASGNYTVYSDYFEYDEQGDPVPGSNIITQGPPYYAFNAENTAVTAWVSQAAPPAKVHVAGSPISTDWINEPNAVDWGVPGSRWIQINFTEAVSVNRMILTNYNDETKVGEETVSVGAPIRFTLKGKNPEDANWTDIFYVADRTAYKSRQVSDYTFAASKKFSQFRLVIDRSGQFTSYMKTSDSDVNIDDYVTAYAAIGYLQLFKVETQESGESLLDGRKESYSPCPENMEFNVWTQDNINAKLFHFRRIARDMACTDFNPQVPSPAIPPTPDQEALCGSACVVKWVAQYDCDAGRFYMADYSREQYSLPGSLENLLIELNIPFLNSWIRKGNGEYWYYKAREGSCSAWNPTVPNYPENVGVIDPSISYAPGEGEIVLTPGISFDFEEATVVEKNGMQGITTSNASLSTAQKHGGTKSLLLSNGYLQIADASAIFNSGSNRFTVDLWVYSNNFNNVSTKRIFEYGYHPNNGVILQIESTNLLALYVSGTKIATYTLDASLNNTWSRFTVIRSGDDFRVLVNGNEVMTGVKTGAVMSGDARLRFGAAVHDTGGWMNGDYIDDVKVYNRVIDPNDVVLTDNRFSIARDCGHCCIITYKAEWDCAAHTWKTGWNNVNGTEHQIPCAAGTVLNSWIPGSKEGEFLFHRKVTGTSGSLVLALKGDSEAVKTVTVPDGYAQVEAYLIGAGGGAPMYIYSGYNPSGAGGYTTGKFPVSPGDVLQVRVGKGGKGSREGAGALGGWPGGGSGSYNTQYLGSGGGGYTSIERNGVLAMVAGGGGGATGLRTPAAGGGLSGQNVANGNAQGGTQTGSVGDYPGSQFQGANADNGNTSTPATAATGGGGGGYWGGACPSGNGGSGAGGSGYLAAFIAGTTTVGVQAARPAVVPTAIFGIPTESYGNGQGFVTPAMGTLDGNDGLVVLVLHPASDTSSDPCSYYTPNPPATPPPAQDELTVCGGACVAYWEAEWDCDRLQWFMPTNPYKEMYPWPGSLAALAAELGITPRVWMKQSGTVYRWYDLIHDYCSAWTPTAPSAFPTGAAGFSVADACGHCCIATYRAEWDCTGSRWKDGWNTNPAIEHLIPCKNDLLYNAWDEGESELVRYFRRKLALQNPTDDCAGWVPEPPGSQPGTPDIERACDGCCQCIFTARFECTGNAEGQGNWTIERDMNYVVPCPVVAEGVWSKVNANTFRMVVSRNGTCSAWSVPDPAYPTAADGFDAKAACPYTKPPGPGPGPEPGEGGYYVATWTATLDCNSKTWNKSGGQVGTSDSSPSSTGWVKTSDNGQSWTYTTSKKYTGEPKPDSWNPPTPSDPPGDKETICNQDNTDNYCIVTWSSNSYWNGIRCVWSAPVRSVSSSPTLPARTGWSGDGRSQTYVWASAKGGNCNGAPSSIGTPNVSPECDETSGIWTDTKFTVIRCVNNVGGYESSSSTTGTAASLTLYSGDTITPRIGFRRTGDNAVIKPTGTLEIHVHETTSGVTINGDTGYDRVYSLTGNQSDVVLADFTVALNPTTPSGQILVRVVVDSDLGYVETTYTLNVRHRTVQSYLNLYRDITGDAAFANIYDGLLPDGTAYYNDETCIQWHCYAEVVLYHTGTTSNCISRNVRVRIEASSSFYSGAMYLSASYHGESFTGTGTLEFVVPAGFFNLKPDPYRYSVVGVMGYIPIYLYKPKGACVPTSPDPNFGSATLKVTVEPIQ